MDVVIGLRDITAGPAATRSRSRSVRRRGAEDSRATISVEFAAARHVVSVTPRRRCPGRGPSSSLITGTNSIRIKHEGAETASSSRSGCFDYRGRAFRDCRRHRRAGDDPENPEPEDGDDGPLELLHAACADTSFTKRQSNARYAVTISGDYPSRSDRKPQRGNQRSANDWCLLDLSRRLSTDHSTLARWRRRVRSILPQANADGGWRGPTPRRKGCRRPAKALQLRLSSGDPWS